MTAEEEAPGSLADRIDRLIKTVHPAGRGPYTLEEISDGIRQQNQGRVTISVPYLHQLHRGKRTNPSLLQLEAIARFFGVPVAYFFDDTEAKKTHEQLALLQAIRDAGLKDLMLRSLDLDAPNREFLARMVRELTELQQKRNPPKRDHQ